MRPSLQARSRKRQTLPAEYRAEVVGFARYQADVVTPAIQWAPDVWSTLDDPAFVPEVVQDDFEIEGPAVELEETTALADAVEGLVRAEAKAIRAVKAKVRAERKAAEAEVRTETAVAAARAEIAAAYAAAVEAMVRAEVDAAEAVAQAEAAARRQISSVYAKAVDAVTRCEAWAAEEVAKAKAAAASANKGPESPIAAVLVRR